MGKPGTAIYMVYTYVVNCLTPDGRQSKNIFFPCLSNSSILWLVPRAGCNIVCFLQDLQILQNLCPYGHIGLSI